MNIWKKALLSFVAIFITVFSVLPNITLAQAQNEKWYAPSLTGFNDKVTGAPDNEIFGERYTQAQVYWIMYSLVNFALGQDVIGCTKNAANVLPCIENLFRGSSGALPGFVNSEPGAILPLAMLVDQTIQYRPASGVGYIAEKIDSLNVVDTAYAQTGFGYETISPVSKLWVAVRNASYALMTVAIVILAFMIMFRTKISPQASLTIQIAIPRIAIALVLITFSFAIAGFLIDIVYLLLGVVGAMFGFSGISTLNAAQLFGALQKWSHGMVSIGVMLILYLLVPTLLTGAASLGIGILAGIVILVLVIATYIAALVRILWLMFRSMLIITMMIVLSPLYILWGVVSSGGGFSSWVKSYMGHLSVFVTVPLVIFFANIVMWGSVGGQSVLAPSPFLNPYGIDTTLLAGGVELPGFFGGFNAIFGMIGGIVMLLSAPKLANSVRDKIISGRAEFGTAGLEAIPFANTIKSGAQKGVEGTISTIVSKRLIP